MAESFDEGRWREAVAEPTWYLELYPELQRLRKQCQADPDSSQTVIIKREIDSFFETGLAGGWIAVGRSGPNFDIDRQPIDTVVVHHTSGEPGLRLARLNVMHLLNLYVPYFTNPTIPGLGGAALWSNHLRDGRPVFYAYHWLMRMDGTFERLLDDDQIGWHAGNRPVNCRSVGICLDNDFEGCDPSPELLQRLGRFIVARYPQVAQENIVGHREVGQKPTTCPGMNFVDGWKGGLLRYIAEAQRSLGAS